MFNKGFIIKYLLPLLFVFGCARDLSEPLTYKIVDQKVVFDFTRADLDILSESNVNDIDEFKELIQKRLSKVDFIDFGSMEGWTFSQLDSNTYRFEKSLNDLEGCLDEGQKMLLDLFDGESRNFADDYNKFGYQQQWPENVQLKTDNNYQFYLKGFNQANTVVLSGSFNNWNTIENQMLKTDSGWIAYTNLNEGKYTYKYIVDGQWTEDPFNSNMQSNEHGTLNSVLVIPNYTFTLKGNQNAENVYLGADFANWNETAIPMRKANGVWQASVYLQQDIYAYKFIVDGNWILDPENNKTIEIDGHTNSMLNLGELYTITLNGYLDAQEVFCAGSFNNWNRDAQPMIKTDKGWTCSIKIPKGNYEYKFVVDGEWIHGNSQLTVPNEFDEKNNWCLVGEPQEFVLNGFPLAKKVILAGSFNNWDEEKFAMIRRDGSWYFPVYLKPGKHLYKFIVDGIWMTDPKNSYSESNWEGSFNSVIWVE